MAYVLITITLLFGDYSSSRKACVMEYQAGHYVQAEVLARTALESARTSNDQYGEALSHSALADVLQAETRLTDAETEYRAALLILNRQSNRNHAAAIVWRNLGSNL
ncbi:MAG TPA: hypothetical protein VKY31_13175, partial [Terriglobia bacterium]|nr:hypothetical protein [Terriglobia bacterium]